jgi:hypothetical protein
LLYATVFLCFAGVVTGALFKIRALVVLLCLVLVESLVLASTDIRTAALWAVINVTAVQISYLAGAFGRDVLEQVGIVLPPAKIRRP